MKFELNDKVYKNLMIFLDRVELKGMKEVHAFNEILNALSRPIKEEKQN